MDIIIHRICTSIILLLYSIDMATLMHQYNLHMMLNGLVASMYYYV
jgi:hypothetical protein